MSWLLGAAGADAAARAAARGGGAGAGAGAGRGGFGWPALLAAAALGASAAPAIAYVARRAHALWLSAGDGGDGENGADGASQRGGEEEEEDQSEVTRAALAYLQRLWDIAMEVGPSGAPADLGVPDSDGVYTFEGRGGTRLYFRRAPAEGRAGPVLWQWSTSKRLWLPTSAADSIWCDSGGSSDNPGPGGRLLIRRLELESQLACGVRRRLSEPMRALPPLELPTLCAAARGARGAASGGGGGVASAGATPRAAAPSPAPSAAAESQGGAEVPQSFLCPLSQRVMTDPVVTPGGMTYDRGALADWIKRKGTDPATGHPLSGEQLYSNLNLRDQLCGFFYVREHMADAAPTGGGRARHGGDAPSRSGSRASSAAAAH
ncbi:hypothetical protein Rsub_07548 [Raphidocelis subcapitata]|uniref:U-box domain-containing protein n=1 Tax=Raphidocelis subcapitata TaxID=307507 RepID=A0A2V0PD02_9CHLO|nr:hypothetical protein Rsub_07548 [Raphidocelis subcapitata]|eukprot:GBF95047.1 hypothetical protein Rsub_07548 [Raphidocelis subcapitata]